MQFADIAKQQQTKLSDALPKLTMHYAMLDRCQQTPNHMTEPCPPEDPANRPVSSSCTQVSVTYHGLMPVWKLGILFCTLFLRFDTLGILLMSSGSVAQLGGLPM